MVYAPATKLEARNLYIHQRLSMRDIGAQTGVAINTISRWKVAAAKVGDCWDNARSASMTGGQGYREIMAVIVEAYMLQHQLAMDELASSQDINIVTRTELLTKLGDSFSKTMATARRSSPSLNKLALAQDVIQYLGSFIKQEFPEHGPAFLEIFEPFVKQVSKRYAR